MAILSFTDVSQTREQLINVEFSTDLTISQPPQPPPMMVSPVNAATLTSGSETFSWNANGNTVTDWWFRLGTTVGGQDIYESGNLGGTSSVTVNTLPTDGSVIHGRLFYRNGSGAWKRTDFTFTSFAAPPPEMVAPINGATLTSGSETFSWNANGNAVTDWWFRLGTTVGGQDIYESGNIGSVNSATVNTLPTDGSVIHGRLFYRNGSGAWKRTDFTFTSFAAPPPEMTAPINGATLTSGSETFSWNANGNAVTDWWFRLGTTVGGQNIYESGNLGGTSSVTVNTLPTDGSVIHGRLFYRNGSGAWKREDFTFTSFDAPSPMMTAPTDGATLTSGSETFSWNANGNAVTDWWFRLGTTVGGQNIYESGNLGGTSSVSVNTLPTDGSVIHGRLFYRNGGGAWKREDFTFTSFDAPSPMMTSPANGATLTSGSETFSWNANGNVVTQWWFRLGTTVGGQDIYESGNLGGTSSVSVNTLPTDGSVIHGRLFYRNGSGAWKREDFTFTSFDAPSPEMTAPTDGATLTSGSETFSWNANGNAVTDWWFRLGTTVGGQDIYESGNLGGTSSVSVNTLPTDGSVIHGRLFYRNGNSAWKREDFTFTAHTQ